MQDAPGHGPGLRLGGVLGARLGGGFSMNGEVTIDRSNVDNTAGVEREWFFRASVSPLFHLPAGTMELGLGPKVGLYSQRTRYSLGGASIENSTSGYSTGINTAAFIPVSAQTSFAVLASFDVMWARPTCFATSANYAVGNCGSTTDVAKVLGLTGGLLF